MTSVDLGMFGLDFNDKSSSELGSDLCIEEFENLLEVGQTQNILDVSLQQSGINQDNTNMETLEVSFLSMFSFYHTLPPLSMSALFFC